MFIVISGMRFPFRFVSGEGVARLFPPPEYSRIAVPALSTRSRGLSTVMGVLAVAVTSGFYGGFQLPNLANPLLPAMLFSVLWWLRKRQPPFDIIG